jgi:hypothetical protein
MNAFSVAMDAIFADQNMATDATYTPQGSSQGTAVRLILSRPDQRRDYLDSRIVVDTVSADVRIADLASPAEGDVFVVQGVSYEMQGEPMRDPLRLIWTIALVPV